MNANRVAALPLFSNLSIVREEMMAAILDNAPEIENPCDIGEHEHQDAYIDAMAGQLDRDMDLLEVYLEAIAA